MLSTIVVLLQTALSLLTLVQGSTTVSPMLRAQALSVADQAIKTATAQIATLPHTATTTSP